MLCTVKADIVDICDQKFGRFSKTKLWTSQLETFHVNKRFQILAGKYFLTSHLCEHRAIDPTHGGDFKPVEPLIKPKVGRVLAGEV